MRGWTSRAPSVSWMIAQAPTALPSLEALELVRLEPVHRPLDPISEELRIQFGPVHGPLHPLTDNTPGGERRLQPGRPGADTS